MEKDKILRRVYIKMVILAVACAFFSIGAAILLKDAVNLLLGVAILCTVGYNAVVLREDTRKNKLEEVYAVCREVQGNALSKNALFCFETVSPIKGKIIYIKAKKPEYLKGLEYCLLFHNPRGIYNESTLLGKEQVIFEYGQRENRQNEQEDV